MIRAAELHLGCMAVSNNTICEKSEILHLKCKGQNKTKTLSLLLLIYPAFSEKKSSLVVIVLDIFQNAFRISCCGT
jgi:hypothetical protein